MEINRKSFLVLWLLAWGSLALWVSLYPSILGPFLYALPVQLPADKKLIWLGILIFPIIIGQIAYKSNCIIDISKYAAAGLIFSFQIGVFISVWMHFIEKRHLDSTSVSAGLSIILFSYIYLLYVTKIGPGRTQFILILNFLSLIAAAFMYLLWRSCSIGGC